VGKTTFINSQKVKNWIDTDDLYNELAVDWHFNSGNMTDVRLNYLRADYISEQTRQYEFRMISALFWDFPEDAVVIPPMKTHKEYKKTRKDLTLDDIKKLRKITTKMAKKFKIPIFKPVASATEYLESKD